MSVLNVYRQIDALYFQSMEQIHSLAMQADSEQSYDEVRSERVKKTTGFLQSISRLLEVARLQTQQVSSTQAQRLFLHDQLEVYRSKYFHLREVLRKKQLENYALESQFIHRQRLRQYDIEIQAEDGEDEDEDGDWDEKDENGEDEKVKKPKNREKFKRESETLEQSQKRLFSGRSQPKKASVDDQILQQNKDISASLRSSKQLMSMSIMQSELNIDTIDQQSQDLRKLNDKLVDLDNLLGKSKQIVKFIEKQDKSDKRRIYLAIGFLLLCSFYVLYRRVLKLPLRIFLWTVFKMFGVVHWFSDKTLLKSGQEAFAPSNPETLAAGIGAPLYMETASGTLSKTLSEAGVEPISESPFPFSETAETPTHSFESMLMDTDYVQDIHSQSVMTWAAETEEESKDSEVFEESVGFGEDAGSVQGTGDTFDVEHEDQTTVQGDGDRMAAQEENDRTAAQEKDDKETAQEQDDRPTAQEDDKKTAQADEKDLKELDDDSTHFIHAEKIGDDFKSDEQIQENGQASQPESPTTSAETVPAEGIYMQDAHFDGETETPEGAIEGVGIQSPDMPVENEGKSVATEASSPGLSEMTSRAASSQETQLSEADFPEPETESSIGSIAGQAQHAVHDEL